MARTSQIKKVATLRQRSYSSPSSFLPTPKPAIHDYPGLGLPLRHLVQDKYGFYPIGAHGSNYEAHSEPIFVREVAMMDVIERLTDKTEWSRKVFDEEIVAKWKKEALALKDEDFYRLATSGKSQYWGDDGVELRDDDGGVMPDNILNGVAFDCCIQELQSKAKYLKKTGIVPTLDACASVAKSDSLVTPELHAALRAAFEKLKADHEAAPDWHPCYNDMVQDFVDPSMYPLIYGRTRAFQQECVGVEDAISHWAGKGAVVPNAEHQNFEGTNSMHYGVGSGTLPPEYWSETYQWLPANVTFQPDGGVKFTSYVNNLHPGKYPNIHRVLEELIKASLPMWDQCLALAADYESREGAGRMKKRMPMVDNADDENAKNWIPEDAQECADAEVTEQQLEDLGYSPDWSEPNRLTEYKWKIVRKPKLPEATFSDISYAPQEGTQLVERFASSGLQVIVKMVSIELTPEKPDFPVGGWHIEGQMNEHIAATSMYYLDSENIADNSLYFRMQTSAYLNDDDAYQVGQDSYKWMEGVYGTGFGCGNSPCLQNYGSVVTKQGRLLAFPNVFQQRVSPFKLIDPTKPGHHRFVTLWLIDPTKRVINTANVPPQQLSWYNKLLLSGTAEARKAALAKLPRREDTTEQARSASRNS
ncbi:hypothetical protein JI435_144630 [Parastagonospora nodorum SN15]|uniref:Uncharacterized protein n=1 Tax=Phaeosphaeria nodorum (strain SN15 / ATCC MYA-4574 / FGSC 10173) TaxID=321614 RepID=A0A7U2I4W6_PHANO|nr:hypothetical protein JI435_144630 [Parastagonospora nodorum SN15]